MATQSSASGFPRAGSSSSSHSEVPSRQIHSSRSDPSYSDDALPLTASKRLFGKASQSRRRIAESSDDDQSGNDNEFSPDRGLLAQMRPTEDNTPSLKEMSSHQRSISGGRRFENALPHHILSVSGATPSSPTRIYLKKTTSTPGGMRMLSARTKDVSDRHDPRRSKLQRTPRRGPLGRSIDDSDLEQEEREPNMEEHRASGPMVPSKHTSSQLKIRRHQPEASVGSVLSPVLATSHIQKTERLLVAHLRMFQREHESYTKICLSQARRALHNGALGKEPIAADAACKPHRSPLKQSPFRTMRKLNAPFSRTRRWDGPTQLLSLTDHDSHVSSNNAHKLVHVPVRYPERPCKEPTIPRYRAFARVNKNVLRQNDRKLLVWPHFEGDLEPEILEYREEIYSRYTQENPPRRIDWLPKEEKSRAWEPYISAFLTELPTECTPVVVLQYLRGTCDLENDKSSQVSSAVWKIFEDYDRWGPSKASFASGEEFTLSMERWDYVLERLPPPTDEQLLDASLACAAFHRLCGFSLWHVVRMSPAIKSILDSLERPNEHVIAFSKFACRVCHIHDCPYHGELEEDDPEDVAEADKVEDLSDPRKLDDHVRINRKTRVGAQNNLSGNTNHKSIKWYYQPGTRLDLPTLNAYLGLSKDSEFPTGVYNQSILESGSEDYFGDHEPCSKECFWIKTNRKISNLTNWSNGVNLLFDQLVHAYAGKRRGPCVLSRCLMQPCNQVFERMLVAASSDKVNGFVIAHGSHPKKASKWWKQPNAHPTKRGVTFYPCQHDGPCEESCCSCARLGITCEKTCRCPSTCSIKFPGCSCKRIGSICWADEKCNCFKWRRECDEDLCGRCGASEILSLRNKYEDEITQGKCGNVPLQRGMAIRTITGASTVSGTGLFLGDKDGAQPGQYIGEYKAEILSKGEADRLGSIYHYEPMNFLFGLNDSQDLDATRAGNKMRFVNHSSDPANINCKADILLCNGALRISFRATRRISYGQELLLNYYWGEKALQGFVEKTANNATPRDPQFPIQPIEQTCDKHSDIDIEELIREADRKYDRLADDDYVEINRDRSPMAYNRESPRNKIKKRASTPQKESPASRERRVRPRIKLNM